MLSTLVTVDDNNNKLEIHKQNLPHVVINSSSGISNGISSFSGPRNLVKLIAVGIGFILVLLILYFFQY